MTDDDLEVLERKAEQYGMKKGKSIKILQHSLQIVEHALDSHELPPNWLQGYNADKLKQFLIQNWPRKY